MNIITQEAVRLAGLGKYDAEIVQYVDNNVNLLHKDTIQVNINPNYSTRKSGDYVTVNISYDIKYITPFVNIFLSSPFHVNAQSTIRVE